MPDIGTDPDHEHCIQEHQKLVENHEMNHDVQIGKLMYECYTFYKNYETVHKAYVFVNDAIPLHLLHNVIKQHDVLETSKADWDTWDDISSRVHTRGAQKLIYDAWHDKALDVSGAGVLPEKYTLITGAPLLDVHSCTYKQWQSTVLALLRYKVDILARIGNAVNIMKQTLTK